MRIRKHKSGLRACRTVAEYAATIGIAALASYVLIGAR